MEGLSAKLLWDIFKHVRSWLANLDRASEARKRQSVEALRRVVTAARQTAVYIGHLEESGLREHSFERRLAALWTELGFELKDLGIDGLAAKCQMRGRLWSDSGRRDRDFLARADASLERIERTALEILDDMES